MKRFLGSFFFLALFAALPASAQIFPGGGGSSSGGTVTATSPLTATTSGTSTALALPGIGGGVFAPVPLGKRNPTGTDDTTLGYTVGSFWNANGQQWLAKSVGAGTANWQLLPQLSNPICDEVTGASGCYGVYRMKAAYAGNAFVVTRSSDSTTLAIGFDVNGIASWSAVDNFCAGTNCGVSTWYDQSGNGYDLTQATAAQRPRIYQAKVGNLRAISFDGANGTAYYLTNTSLPITSRNSFTALVLMTPVNSSNLSVNGGDMFVLNSSSANWFYYTNLTTAGGDLRISPGSGNVATNGVLTTEPQAFLSVDSAGTVTLSQNNLVYSPITTGFSAAASTGIIVGSSFGNFEGSMAGFIIYNSALSSANQQTLLQASYRDTNIQPQSKTNIVLYASSLICCTGGVSPPNQIFPAALQQSLNDPVNMVSYGYGGATLNSLNSTESAFLAEAKFPGANNILIPDGASNDFANSSSITAATVYGYLQTACSTAHAGGYKCYIMSLFPRTATFGGGQTSAGFETDRQALLALEKAGPSTGWQSFADGFIDPADDPTVGPQSATVNTALFTDQVHLALPLGMAYEAAIHTRGLSGVVQ